MKRTPEGQAEHLKKCLKKITLKFLQSGWGSGRIKDLKLSRKLVLGSDKMLYLSEWKKRGFTRTSLELSRTFLHCVWSEDHDKTLKHKRRHIEKFGRIFVSQICDVAVAEYAKVCKILGLKKILIISFKDDTAFFRKSLKLLKIPGVETDIIKW